VLIIQIKLQNKKRKKLEELTAQKQRIETLEKTYNQNKAKLTKIESDKQQSNIALESFNLATQLFAMASYKEAEILADKALQIRIFLATVESADAAECLNLLAKICKADGKYERALQLYEDVYKIASKLQLHEKTAEYLTNIGDIYVKLAKYDESDKRYSEALSISKQYCGSTSKKTAEILNAIGLLAKKNSEYDKAIQVLTDAMKIISIDDNFWSELALNLADVYRKKGNYKDARDLYLRILTKLEQAFGESHPQIATVSNALGMLEKKEGHYNEALKYYKNALRIGKHFFGKAHPDIGMYLTNLGDIWRKKGDFKKGRTSVL